MIINTITISDLFVLFSDYKFILICMIDGYLHHNNIRVTFSSFFFTCFMSILIYMMAITNQTMLELLALLFYFLWTSFMLQWEENIEWVFVTLIFCAEMFLKCFLSLQFFQIVLISCVKEKKVWVFFFPIK